MSVENYVINTILAGSGRIGWSTHLPALQLYCRLICTGKKISGFQSKFQCETVIPPVTQYYENLLRAVTAGKKLINPLSETEDLIRMIDRVREFVGENGTL